ncbi:putative glycosidase CRH2 [Umbelopsis sp. WA50703]|jgi:beta-glucanase (GH16 family)
MISLKISSLAALVIAGVALNTEAAAINTQQCSSFQQNFTVGSDLTQYWKDMDSTTYDLTSQGLEMKVNNPNGDGKVGNGALFNSKMLMQYGSIEAKIKAAPVGGIVTAFIFMAPGKDEIDYEWVGDQVQSAYYYRGIPDYSTEASVTLETGTTDFHIYKIDWQPDAITWYIDGKPIRTVEKNSTLESDNQYHYPTEASHFQLGLWDASGDASTAKWAHGPIDWSDHPGHVSAFVEYVNVECNSN